MKTMGIKKRLAFVATLAATVFMLVALCACGPKEIDVTIVDGGESTEFTAQAGMTVADILDAAAVTVNEGDEVSPALDSEVEESGATITIERVKKVVIEDNGKTVDVELLSGTVQDALEKAGITLEEGDVVTPGLSTAIEGEGLSVTIERVKKVTVAADDQNIEVALLDGTVQDALEKAGVTLEEGDTVDIEVATPIEDGMVITVTRYVPEPEPEPEPAPAPAPQASSSSSSSNGGGSSSASSEPAPASDQKSVVSRVNVPNCSGDGHGYYEITWSDGSMTYEEY